MRLNIKPYVVQDIVPLFASSDLNELAQEERCTLGNGSELCCVLRLTLQTANLHMKINCKKRLIRLMQDRIYTYSAK
jgi:hypothetical protein